jgi:tRNA threonylcarbamoyladenosine biosynthesis protein TsaE
MPDNSIKLVSHSTEQTQNLGRYLGELACEGDVFLLSGNLGSGKTSLTQGIAWGLDVKEYAFSPSFLLIREYHGRLPLYHIDLYRLEHIKEIENLYLEEYLNSKGLCVIEWAEKGMDLLPQENLHITLDYLSLTDRTLNLKPSGKRYLRLIKSLEPKLKTWN